VQLTPERLESIVEELREQPDGWIPCVKQHMNERSQCGGGHR
jgi:hypothetical protein